MAKRNGLSAEPWWSPTPTVNSLVNPAALLTVVVAPSYISWEIGNPLGKLYCHPKIFWALTSMYYQMKKLEAK